MVPKVAKRGKSFKGAASYYLHDKGAQTTERIAFTETRNLPTDDPDLAWRFMAYTALHADDLKRETGVAPTGRKLETPVYSYSLAWHPDEKPTPDDMRSAADASLKALGLEAQQAIMVAHRDEPHPHLHIIVNLVDPDTGKARDPGLDKKKLSRWAEAFERTHGNIRCEQRVENNRRRDAGEIVKDRTSLTRAEIEQQVKIAGEIMQAPRLELALRMKEESDALTRKAGQLDNGHDAERDALKREAAQRAREVQAQLKEKFRPIWADYYRKQREDQKDARNARLSLLASFRVAIKERRRLRPDGRAGLSTILAYALDGRALGYALQAASLREKAALREAVADERKALVRDIWQEFGRDIRALKTIQEQERKAFEDAEREALKAKYKAQADELERQREEEKEKKRDTERERERDWER